MESIFFCRQQKYTAKQDPWTGSMDPDWVDVVRISGNLPRICNQKPICQQLCKVAGH